MDFDLKAGADIADIIRIVMELVSGSNVMKAHFFVPGQSALVKVSFLHVDILRVIDDMQLPFEERNIPTTGHVSNHFVYQVEGAPFWAPQQELLQYLRPDTKHYRFVTGGSCLDVISRHEPVIEWVANTDE
jgi:hypothetical protein